MVTSAWPFVWLLLVGLLLAATAALAISSRSLNRLQRKAWLDIDSGDEEDSDDTYVVVESAMGAISLTRQLLLVTLVLQTVAVQQHSWPGAGFGLAAALAGSLYLLFDKALPYGLLSLLGAERVLATGDLLSRVIQFLLGPAARVLMRLLYRARERSLARGDGDQNDLGAFLDLAEEEGLVTGSGESWLRGFAEFEETVAREVMTPRVDIVAIDQNATLGELHELIAARRLSRIPVMNEDLDHVVGIVHLKDLVAALETQGEEAPLSTIARPAWFIPESKRVSELLPELQRRQMQMTIVVDEYGGTAGLVTLEDVLEEIVGEIQDESEPQEQLIEVNGDEIVASGKAEIEELEEALQSEIPEGDFHTVGGMVFTHLGHVPEAGEAFEWAGLRIEVLEADDRRIQRVRVTRRDT